ncbi:MAG: sigma-70 family RNA polymerase sigma factor [Verrucomicrobiota bacterium]
MGRERHAGNSDLAFERLAAEHRRGLRAYLMTVVQDYHLAEDILQESLAIVAKTWSREAVHDFRAYSREVARRQALKMIRRRENEPIPLSEEALDALQDAFDRASLTKDDTRVAALRFCLTKLPKHWKRILDLRYWEEKKIKTIAARLTTQPNVVSVTINRAKSRLADCVASKIRIEEVRG